MKTFKEILSILLAVSMICSTSIISVMAYSNNDSDTNCQSQITTQTEPTAKIKKEAWQLIQSKIESQQQLANSNITKSISSSSTLNYSTISTDQLIEQYIALKNGEKSKNGSELLRIKEDLEAIETCLNSQGTVFLTEKQLQTLFPAPQLYVVTNNSTRSASNTYPIETSTSKNYWTATSTSTYNGYNCAIISAFPKENTSSLYALYENVNSIGGTEYNLTRATLYSLWKSVEDTALQASGLGALSTILGIAPSSNQSTATYSADIVGSTRAKFCWVYQASTDSYVLMAVAHNLQENTRHKYNPASGIFKDKITSSSRSTAHFSDLAIKQKAVTQFISNPYQPYIEYFALSGTKNQYTNSSGNLVSKQFTYTPPYATSHMSVD